MCGDDPAPGWPEAASGERCACGRTLKYIHIVHECAEKADEIEAFQCQQIETQ